MLGSDTDGIHYNVRNFRLKLQQFAHMKKANHLIKNDTISDEFACCGGYSYNIGYQDWKHSHMGMQYNSVPDSCCLRSAPKCGWGIFRNYDDRNVYPQIFTHGCITLLQRRLETQVVVSTYFLRILKVPFWPLWWSTLISFICTFFCRLF